MPEERNTFLDHGSSEESDIGGGYDSEAAEQSKGGRTTSSSRSVKRRKLRPSQDEVEEDRPTGTEENALQSTDGEALVELNDSLDEEENETLDGVTEEQALQPDHSGDRPQDVQKDSSKSKKRLKEKTSKPGVVYLSSLPPYLKPSALRNLLIQRGFSPINRLFLTPASKAKASSKKNSRQLYTEGWIEFASKKMARTCAETLNAQIIGGKKGGFYYDDIWNMKYLKGMAWNELMAGIREERREEEGRRDEERRTIAQETKRFIEGVEEGRKVEGMKRKRKEKLGKDGESSAETGDVKRTWRQFEVKGKPDSGRRDLKQDRISDDAREVLGKIF